MRGAERMEEGVLGFLGSEQGNAENAVVDS